MNFFIVFTKNRKKFDKYVKINKIRNKIIVDTKEIINEENIDFSKHKEYFNLIIYTKIIHAFRKNKNVYYIPDFINNEDIDSKDIFKIKELFKKFNFEFNCLLFYNDFIDNENNIKDDFFENLHVFDKTLLIEDF